MDANFLTAFAKACALGVQAGAFGWALAQARWTMKRSTFWTLITVYLAASGIEYLARFVIWYNT